MSLWLSLFAAMWSTYVVLALLSARASGREVGEVLVAVVATSGALFARIGIEGTSLLGTLRGATLALGLIILVTGGRPARIFDPPGMKARAYRRLSRAEREAIDRRDRASCLSQLAFFLCLIIGIAAYVIAGWTFLD